MTETLKTGYFVSTTYRKNDDQSLVPDLPDKGPCCDDLGCCQLGIKDRRKRSTGPKHLLFIVNCKTHHTCFTLYPPGFAPHGRTPLVPLAPDGSTLNSDRGPPFEGSFFQALLDGIKGKAWPKECFDDSQMPRFETQTRHLARICKLFRLFTVSDKEREWVADLLNVPGLLLHQAHNAIKKTKGYQAVVSAMIPILEQLSETRLTFQGLSACGYYAGIWSKNQFWNVKTGKWHDFAFQGFPSQ